MSSLSRTEREKEKGKFTKELGEYINNRIVVDRYPPDVIANEIGSSAKTIYNWIDKRIIKAKNIDHWQKVGRKPRKKGKKQWKRQLGTSIDLRPKHINNRSEFGHWEGDTIVGKGGRSAFLTLTERMTGKGIAIKLRKKSANSVVSAIKKLNLSQFKSITFDNGTEFAKVNKLKKYKIQIYFAHPYSAYERGTNEHFNGMLRRFFPKGKDLSVYTQSQIDHAVDWINYLPRRSKNYQPPTALFQALRGIPLSA